MHRAIAAPNWGRSCCHSWRQAPAMLDEYLTSLSRHRNLPIAAPLQTSATPRIRPVAAKARASFQASAAGRQLGPLRGKALLSRSARWGGRGVGCIGGLAIDRGRGGVGGVLRLRLKLRIRDNARRCRSFYRCGSGPGAFGGFAAVAGRSPERQYRGGHQTRDPNVHWMTFFFLALIKVFSAKLCSGWCIRLNGNFEGALIEAARPTATAQNPGSNREKFSS